MAKYISTALFLGLAGASNNVEYVGLQPAGGGGTGTTMNWVRGRNNQLKENDV